MRIGALLGLMFLAAGLAAAVLWPEREAAQTGRGLEANGSPSRPAHIRPAAWPQPRSGANADDSLTSTASQRHESPTDLPANAVSLEQMIAQMREAAARAAEEASRNPFAAP